MSTYTVQRGDSLSKIAAKLKTPGGWPKLYEWNKNIIGSNPNLIFAGTVLQTSAPSSRGTPTATAASVSQAPSTSIGQEGAKGGDKRQAFDEKYGSLQELMPTAAFWQMAAEQLNPELLRNSSRSAIDYDRAMAKRGSRGGMALSDRSAFMSDLERARKDTLNEWVLTQQDAFKNWYTAQMEAYGTAKNPSGYKLPEFGIEIPGVTDVPTVETYKPGYTYEYNPAFDFTNQFGYGGYKAIPDNYFGSITKTEI